MGQQLLLVKIAEMFYREDLSKSEIAARLRLSRFKVARLLEQARAEGIVTIEIHHPSIELYELERELEERLALQSVIIIEGTNDPEETKRMVAGTGAKLLLQTLNTNDVLGVSWGTTVKLLLSEIPEHPRERAAGIVQISGGLSLINDRNDMRILNSVGYKLNSQVNMFAVPLLVASPEMKSALLCDPALRETYELFQTVTVAITGVGSCHAGSTANIMLHAHYPNQDICRLTANGAVGDIFNHVFNAEGDFVDTYLDDRLVTMPTEQLRKIRRIIAVSSGAAKAQALIGAVRSGLVHSLVTDRDTASTMLELLGQFEPVQ